MAKVLISLDAILLQKIDRIAKSNGLSRSAYITRLAERDAALVSARARAPVTAAFARLDRLFADSPPGDSTVTMRAERDAR